ncbi:MAG: J domain-containing protein [Microcoleaceae cyanobacterium]
MSSDRTRSTSRTSTQQGRQAFAGTHYGCLGLHPSASPVEIRRAYRQLSKCYHPDTTSLPKQVATQKFQELNEAYATLSSPERRLAYDQTIRYSRYSVIQPVMDLDTSNTSHYSRSAYLDPTDRPLSSGEVFALLMLGLSLAGCLVLAIVVGLIRPDLSLQPIQPPGLTLP